MRLCARLTDDVGVAGAAATAELVASLERHVWWGLAALNALTGEFWEGVTRAATAKS